MFIVGPAENGWVNTMANSRLSARGSAVSSTYIHPVVVLDIAVENGAVGQGGLAEQQGTCQQ